MTVPAIDDLPTPPQPQDEKPTFNTRMFAWIIAIQAWTTAVNAVSAAINAAYTAIEGFLSSANSAAATASAAALTATANATAAAGAAGASAWVSGATYAIGDKRWSLVNGRVYVRRTAGAGTTDPSIDRTNWGDMTELPRTRITGATTLVAGNLYELDSTGGSFSVTLPATFYAGDRIGFVDVGLALGSSPVTILRNGNNIRRTAEDLICDQPADSFFLVGQTSIGWIEE